MKEWKILWEGQAKMMFWGLPWSKWENVSNMYAVDFFLLIISWLYCQFFHYILWTLNKKYIIFFFISLLIICRQCPLNSNLIKYFHSIFFQGSISLHFLPMGSSVKCWFPHFLPLLFYFLCRNGGAKNFQFVCRCAVCRKSAMILRKMEVSFWVVVVS